MGCDVCHSQTTQLRHFDALSEGSEPHLSGPARRPRRFGANAKPYTSTKLSLAVQPPKVPRVRGHHGAPSAARAEHHRRIDQVRSARATRKAAPRREPPRHRGARSSRSSTRAGERASLCLRPSRHTRPTTPAGPDASPATPARASPTRREMAQRGPGLRMIFPAPSCPGAARDAASRSSALLRRVRDVHRCPGSSRAAPRR